MRQAIITKHGIKMWAGKGKRSRMECWLVARILGEDASIGSMTYEGWWCYPKTTPALAAIQYAEMLVVYEMTTSIAKLHSDSRHVPCYHWSAERVLRKDGKGQHTYYRSVTLPEQIYDELSSA